MYRLCSGAVLCVTMTSNGEQCFSGGVDGNIQSWNLPNPNIDPYDSYGIFQFLSMTFIRISESQF